MNQKSDDLLKRHLLGIYEKATPPDLTWPERFRLAEKLGFDYVEISIDETDERLARLYWGEAERRAFREAIWESKMPVQSMCLSGHRRYPFGSADAQTRETAREIMERAILFAREFGIRVIQLAGYDVYYEPSTEESKKRFLEGLRWATVLAAKYQVMLAMEIMDTELMSSISRYRAYKQAIPSPWFTVYPDMGNLSAWGNDVLGELELGKNDIVAVHIKETLPVMEGAPGKFKRVPFGTGCVDFSAAFRKLEQIGFTGPYMIEMWYEKGQDAEREIQKALSFVRKQYQKGCGE